MSVRYQGRLVDPVALWEQYVEFPSNMDANEGGFLPLTVCPNPEHQTTKRHFQVNAEKPLVHCFAGCGISGTYEHAIAMIEGCTHRAARRVILKHSRIGKVVRKKNHVQKEIPKEALEYERYMPEVAMEYLTSRGISFHSRNHWELGWDAEQQRIVIPACDYRGRVKFLIGRAVKPRVEPRYLYTEGADKNAILFGLDKIDPRLVQSQGVIVVEGSLDTIVMHQHGFRNTVGTLSSRLSKIQARQIASLRPKRIVTMFDADVAGIEATISVADRIPRYQIRVVRFPKGKADPAQLTEKEARRAIDRAISFQRFQELTHHIARRRQPRKEFSRA